MHEILFLLPRLPELGIWAYWFLFAVTLLETAVVVGIIVPGATMIMLMAFLASQGFFNVFTLFWFAAGGAILGDWIGYYLGTKGESYFQDEAKWLKKSHIERGRAFFKKYGNASVFIGRFLAPIRAIVPFLAGVLGMDQKPFIFWNFTSGTIWTITHLLIGYYFGALFIKIESHSSRAAYVFVVVIALAVFFTYLWLAHFRGRNKKQNEEAI
jgi:undecaprenyl-diphosphatase